MKDDFAALRTKVDDGFVFILEDGGGSGIVAEGLHFANGLAFSKDYQWLYIVESSTRRIVRAPVLPGGRLGAIENFGPELEATPDGIGFDEDENLWVTLLIEKNALVILDRSADVHNVVEDPSGTILGRPTNVSFGGADLCDLYVGSLDRDCVLHARVDIPGVALPGQTRLRGNASSRQIL
jgi:gluconolactonase